LLRAHKASGGDRAKKLFQFLNEIGARALRMHLGRVLEMAESSPNRDTYEQKIMERFGGERQLELPMPNASAARSRQLRRPTRVADDTTLLRCSADAPQLGDDARWRCERRSRP
jgi:hypothetical protein